MMSCPTSTVPNCKAAMKPQTKKTVSPFCQRCGERLPALKPNAVACPSCGADLPSSGSHSSIWSQARTAGLLSLLVPGAGQVFNGQLFRGLFIFATCWLIVPWLFGVIDAYGTARRAELAHTAPQMT